MDPADKKTVVHIRIDPKLRDQGNKKAKQYGLSLAAYIRALLKNGIEGPDELVLHPPPPPKRRSA